MKRFHTLLNRTKSTAAPPSKIHPTNCPPSSGADNTSTTRSASSSPPHAPDSPEATATAAIHAFCASPDITHDYLHLPAIVDACESSPAAAAAAALQIRKYLTLRDYGAKPAVQYNAIMLVRILADNPGATFTRCFDKVFVGTVKELLRKGGKKSVQTLLRETLDALEVGRGGDEGCALLVLMWRKEKGGQGSLSEAGVGGGRQAASFQQQQQQQQQQQYGQGGAPYQDVYASGGVNAPTPQQQQQQQQQLPSGRAQMPSPSELAGRVEEARNTAKILMQLLASTPADEVLQNELLKEFSARCQSAQKSMQTYINCDPDDDTMQTLIEANEQLSLAGSRYQRAVLAARRAMGAGVSPVPSSDAVPRDGGSAALGGGGYGVFAAPARALQGGGGAALDPAAASGNGDGTHFRQAQLAQQTGNGEEEEEDDEDYRAPPGPPPQQYHQRQSPQNPLTHAQNNNPFDDPEPNLPPSASAQTNYSTPLPASTSPRNPNPTARQNPAGQTHYEQQPQTDNAYPSSAVSAPSPTWNTRGEGAVSPPQLASAGGEGQRKWQGNGAATRRSYLGRQQSAADGLTMHGARALAEEEEGKGGRGGGVEIDSFSALGRTGEGGVREAAR
ncbi:hypothetical protein LTR08_000917 [Meristemomyces frigidus]|nr:hypothetical protein LTR08_000917 [Meristemomyces frigidus]